ncbi:hypothetical protein GCM10010401_11530 [Rarobacter faecitabidus]|uniref:Multicomponent Na+:H+ antiporter subunit F n=1 Tax=Rarobacter faecitabidus TaxID=13243 RepID=A0A542ZPE2_RARFA|nr:monovalent cation/H+ antiporter complex subunit F [Rarobacter faecitabidus]TQL62109.1 multicomponent Na+:H+ antiporter subunit F [Rarobacter faecitabidus]
MIYLYIACAVMLLVAAILAIMRAERGPSMLDRTVALDLFATVIVAGIATEAAWSKRVDILPVLVTLSMVGFISSVVFARFASVEPAEARRIKSAAEVELELARRLAEEAAQDEAEILAHQRLLDQQGAATPTPRGEEQ